MRLHFIKVSLLMMCGASCLLERSCVCCCKGVCKSGKLTLSFPKTKFMVVGSSVSVDEQQPLAAGG